MPVREVLAGVLPRCCRGQCRCDLAQAPEGGRQGLLQVRIRTLRTARWAYQGVGADGAGVGASLVALPSAQDSH